MDTIEKKDISMHSPSNTVNISDRSTVRSDGIRKIKASPYFIKSVISQFGAISGSVLLALEFGMMLGYISVLSVKLAEKDGEMEVSESELSWITSVLMVTVPLGALSSILTVQYVGQKGTLMLAAFFSIALWIVLYYVKTALQIIVVILMMGGIIGLIESPVQVYVAECCEPRVRSSGISAFGTGTSVGTLLQISIGSHFHWRNLALVNATLPLVTLLTLIFLPESPYWLARKDRLEASRRALCWLRGWTTPDQVTEEFNAIVQSTRKTERQVKSSISETIKRYNRRSFYYPFALSVFTFFLSTYNGECIIMIFAVFVMEKLDSPINKYYAASVLATMQSIGIAASIVVWPFFGKRKPTLFSLAVSGVAFLLLTTCEHLKSLQALQLYGTSFSWMSFITLSLAMLASSLGIRITPWVLTSEILPVDVRGPGTSLATVTVNIQAAIAYKIYLYVVKEITLVGTFIAFAVINFVGFTVLYFKMPETEGLSLVELEKLYGRNRSKKNKACLVNETVELDPLCKK